MDKNILQQQQSLAILSVLVKNTRKFLWVYIAMEVTVSGKKIRNECISIVFG